MNTTAAVDVTIHANAVRIFVAARRVPPVGIFNYMRNHTSVFHYIERRIIIIHERVRRGRRPKELLKWP